jgi:septum site-determining protein MinC
MAILIKGIKDGLHISFGEGDWNDLETELLATIAEKTTFFQGAKLALDVGTHDIRAAEMGSLRDKLADRGITLWAMLGTSTTTEKNAQALGLATRLSRPKVERTTRPLDSEITGENAIFLHRTLRSGFKVSYPGHVVVVGDVNPGAEIIAGGSVVVWGKLKGMVHAGAEGDENAFVCALDLSPTQLRISDFMAVSPKRKGKPLPEVVRLRDGQVVAEPWDTKSSTRD